MEQCGSGLPYTRWSFHFRPPLCYLSYFQHLSGLWPRPLPPAPPTHWQLEHSSPQGSSLEVSGDELPTHLAHTAYSHCPRWAGPQPCHLAFCQLLPTQRQFQPFGQAHSQTLRPVTCRQLCKALGLNGNCCFLVTSCVTLDGYFPCLESDLLIGYLLICAAHLTQLPPSPCPGAEHSRDPARPSPYTLDFPLHPETLSNLSPRPSQKSPQEQFYLGLPFGNSATQRQLSSFPKL